MNKIDELNLWMMTEGRVSGDPDKVVAYFCSALIDAGVAERTGKTVKLGRMNWHADSYHIYGKDIHSAKERLFERVNDMAFEERTMPFNDDFIREMYENAEPVVINKIKEFDARHA